MLVKVDCTPIRPGKPIKPRKKLSIEFPVERDREKKVRVQPGIYEIPGMNKIIVGVVPGSRYSPNKVGYLFRTVLMLPKHIRTFLENRLFMLLGESNNDLGGSYSPKVDGIVMYQPKSPVKGKSRVQRWAKKLKKTKDTNEKTNYYQKMFGAMPQAQRYELFHEIGHMIDKYATKTLPKKTLKQIDTLIAQGRADYLKNTLNLDDESIGRFNKLIAEELRMFSKPDILVRSKKRLKVVAPLLRSLVQDHKLHPGSWRESYNDLENILYQMKRSELMANMFMAHMEQKQFGEASGNPKPSNFRPTSTSGVLPSFTPLLKLMQSEVFNNRELFAKIERRFPKEKMQAAPVKPIKDKDVEIEIELEIDLEKP